MDFAASPIPSTGGCCRRTRTISGNSTGYCGCSRRAACSMGEIVALDADDRPIFNNLLFARGAPVYVAFDILFDNGRDVRAEPLKRRKARLKKTLAKGALQSDYIVRESGSLF